MNYLYASAFVFVICLVLLLLKIHRENRRKPVWIGDPEKELMLHATSAREKLWGGSSANWKQSVDKQHRQENEDV
jgi:hypothetical protein